MVLAGNKAKRLSSVNYTTKTIHHHHHLNALIAHMHLCTYFSPAYIFGGGGGVGLGGGEVQIVGGLVIYSNFVDGVIAF